MGPVWAVVGLDLWSLVGAQDTWGVFAATIRNSVVLWRVVFGDLEPFVGGLGAVSRGGELWCGGDTSRVVAALGFVVVVLLTWSVWRFTARAQILPLLGCFEFQFLCHGFEVCEAEVESCEH